ncbi:SIMPL domain-containing protein [Flammeovirga kamogawensis]|uniref:SIMPL domain-containing protein n=1 Tax=Flammeovirga kamogawensis TaxID=373891 RepID=A0ABX8H3W7_9BACT|nr:SIMPL domain-containing protein [Flammeovirga kamogawensis]MBB6460322.1 hypothetical protein [Flammeovirga kamogawensis]QWG10131.1 SIMPL domain-containing protein [Flammeovirga kamogawensis]TRX65640.1 DUF541 domain-containing protein [Flammeovirga kamogawensis]
MKNILTAFLLIMSTQIMNAQSKNFIDQPYIETSASVDSLVAPDDIHLIITLDEIDTKNKVSTEVLENKMNKALKSLGIDTKNDLVVADFSSEFNKSFLKGQKVYKAKQYDLVVHTAFMASKVMKALEKENISHIRLGKLEYSKADELESILRVKAIRTSRATAQTLAEGIGQQAGKAIHIIDNTSNNNRQIRMYASDSWGDNESYNKKEQPLDLGIKKITFSSSVRVKYILE